MCWPCCEEVLVLHSVCETPAGLGTVTRLDRNDGSILWTTNIADFGYVSTSGYTTAETAKAWASNAIIIKDRAYIAWLPACADNPEWISSAAVDPPITVLPSGGVACIDMADGSILWNVTFPDWANSSENLHYLHFCRLTLFWGWYRADIRIDIQGNLWVFTPPDDSGDWITKLDINGNVLAKYGHLDSYSMYPDLTFTQNSVYGHDPRLRRPEFITMNPGGQAVQYISWNTWEYRADSLSFTLNGYVRSCQNVNTGGAGTPISRILLQPRTPANGFSYPYRTPVTVGTSATAVWHNYDPTKGVYTISRGGEYNWETTWKSPNLGGWDYIGNAPGYLRSSYGASGWGSVYVVTSKSTPTYPEVRTDLEMGVIYEAGANSSGSVLGG